MWVMYAHCYGYNIIIIIFFADRTTWQMAQISWIFDVPRKTNNDDIVNVHLLDAVWKCEEWEDSERIQQNLK